MDRMTDQDIRDEIEELLDAKFRHGSAIKRIRDDRILTLWAELDRREKVTIYIA